MNKKIINNTGRDTYNKRVALVTGGTSGLGLEIVKILLRQGHMVIATGRKTVDLPGYEERFRLYRVDFSDFKQTSEIIREICNNHKIDIVINNAGVLSPPVFTPTMDGFEYTFQVNFLAHLLINEYVIRLLSGSGPLTIAVVTSPVYRLGKCDTVFSRDPSHYNPLGAYSDSKLMLALMCKQYSVKYKDAGLRCFSFDPGIFASGIYRMQNSFFGLLYRIASPFMRKPSSVASVLCEILEDDKFSDGDIYNIRKKSNTIRDIKKIDNEDFLEKCLRIVLSYTGF